MLDEGCRIEGDLDELLKQIQSGEAAEGYARLQASNLQRLRELAEAAGRVSYPLHTPLAPGEMPPDMPEPEPTQPFAVRLREMLRETYDVRSEAPDAGR